MKRKIIIFISVFIPVAVLDQLSKYFINNGIGLFQKIPVAKHYFDIVHVDNTGVAFGFMHNHSNVIIIIFTALVIAAIAYAFFKSNLNSFLFSVSASLVISGAFSNLISRIFQGYVVDFLDFHIFKYHWPSFNIADSSVVVGTVLFFISIIKYI